MPDEYGHLYEDEVISCFNCVLKERQDKDHYVCLAGNGIIHTSEIKQECNCDDYSPYL